MAFSSSSSSELKLKRKQVMEMKVDQLGRLPDEVMMLIINKLFHAKTLIRLSMAAKRYFSLVSQTHSLLMDFNLQGDAAASTPINYNCPPFDEQISVITHRFNQIKRLHLHVRSDNPPRPVIPLGSGRFSQWVAVFGDMLEEVHFLATPSVLLKANPGNGTLNNNNSEEEEEEPSRVFDRATENAAWMYVLIRGIVSKCEMLESVVFTNNCSEGGGVVFMAKQHIAKLRKFLIVLENQDDEDQFEFVMSVSREPTLGLPRSGCTLNDVVFKSFYSNGETSTGMVFDCVGASLDGIDSSGFDFDMDKWQVFHEAAHLFENENNCEPMLFVYTLPRLLIMN